MLSVTICDDEPEQTFWLETLVRQWARERKAEVDIACCRNGEQFLFWQEERHTDIALLDIDMPGMDGIGLARRLREMGDDMQILFVTGHGDYAVEGYEVEAVSYLMKPVGQERMFQCLESAQGQKKREAAKQNLYSGHSQGIEAYVENFWNLLLNLGGMLVYAGIVARASLWLLVLLVSQTFLASALHLLAGRRVYAMDEEMEQEWKKFGYLRRESIVPANGKDIRLYRMDRWFVGALQQVIEKICKLTVKGQDGFLAAGVVEKLLTFARNAVVYGWLIRDMVLGNLALPVFLLYVGVVSGFEGWMGGLFDSVQQILQNKRLMDDYRDFMEYGSVEEGRAPVGNPGQPHELRLEKVCFRYEGSKEDTIHDLNLTIRAGERLALVGCNGAGKTTLIKMLCGLYAPTSGHIYLDGQDMQTLSRKEIFWEFAVVFQDCATFSFSLGENVSCVEKGREEDEKLQKSLADAGLLERAGKLPGGIWTSVNKDLDEEGVSLSGGEMQKLMLARALYKNAPIVILDEPTAALDPIAESEMYEKYDEMIQGKTAIFISHRLSSTRFCNRILYLENGRIFQEGSHEELMAEGGAYAALFALQAKYYKRDTESGAVTSNCLPRGDSMPGCGRPRPDITTVRNCIL